MGIFREYGHDDVPELPAENGNTRMTNDIPDPDDLSLPSSVTESDDSIPVGELRALVGRWMNRYDSNEGLGAWEAGDSHGHAKCSGELESLIEGHTDE